MFGSVFHSISIYFSIWCYLFCPSITLLKTTKINNWFRVIASLLLLTLAIAIDCKYTPILMHRTSASLFVCFVPLLWWNGIYITVLLDCSIAWHGIIVSVLYKFILCEAFFRYEMLTTQTTVTCHKQICYKLIFRLSGCETHLSSKCIKISNGKIYIGHYSTIYHSGSSNTYMECVYADKYLRSIWTHCWNIYVANMLANLKKRNLSSVLR